MKTSSRVLALLLLFIPSLVISQSFPVRIERTIAFDTLSVRHGRFSMEVGKGSVALIECEKGVTGVVLVSNGVFSYLTDQAEPLRDSFTKVMLRFNPAKYTALIKPSNAQTGADLSTIDAARSAVSRIFRYLYHSGSDALLPNEDVLAGFISAEKLGDIIVHDVGRDSSMVLSITQRKMLFQSKRETPSSPGSSAADSLSSHLRRRISTRQLGSDLDFIVSKISTKEYDRDPFAYVDKAAFFRTVDSARKVLPFADSMSLKDFYMLAARIIALVKDDHATLQISGDWARPALEGKPFAERIVLPMSLIVKDSTCIAISADGIPLRSRVLSLNGISVLTLVQKVLQLRSSSEYYALKSGLVGFFDFPKYSLELFAIAGLKDSVLVRYIPPDQKTVSQTSVNLYHYFDRAAWSKSVQTVALQRKPLRQARMMDDVAVLSLGSFRLSNDREKEIKEWISFFDSTFQSLSATKTRDLLVDISENGGGAEIVGHLLLNYIWSGRVKTTAGSNEYSTDSLVKVGVFSETQHLRYEDFKWPRFSGRVYLLIGERTFSSAARFADIFKTCGAGLIIGRPTRAFRSHYGELAAAPLPNSGLPFTWSTKFFVSASGDVKPRGIQPDILISLESPEDMVKTLTDELLVTKAVQLIRQRRTQSD